MGFFRKYTYWVMAAVLIILMAAGCSKDIAKPGAVNSPKAPLAVQVVDVGQGDAILIRTPGQIILVDTGDVPAKEKLVSYIKSQGITTIDKVIITHPHADHLGGMNSILENFAVKQVYDSGQTTTTPMYRQYLTLVQKKNIPFAVLAAGNQIDIGGGVVLKILNPDKPFIAGKSDLNNNSVVAKLIYGNFSMLLTGDAEQEAEAHMLEKFAGELRSTVLKSGHHGSNTSSSPAFLKAVAPEVAIISVGVNNDYHHPHPSTLKKYADLKLKVYRTDLNGTVTVTSDGQTYAITQEKQ